jgi:hypothetical protein
VVGDATSVASGILDLLLWSNATSGNLWIDEVSLRYFPSRQAACEWMGCVAEPNKLDFTLPTGTTVPSVKAARGRNATFWVNNPSTQSIGTLYDGVPGQEITLGILENNTKFYKLLHMTNVFPCRNDGTFDSNRNGQVAWNYFQTPTAGDCIYAGHQGAPFAGLTFQVGTAVTGTGLSFTWQYWNGSAWADLGVATPDQFTATGAKTVYWYPPADWQRNRINNVTAYWIKITANGSITNTGANATAAMNGSNLRLKADFGRPGGDHQTCWLKLKNYNGCWFELGNSTE